MSVPNERSRNNLRAGLFVVVATALAIATFVLLQQISWTSRTTYRLQFLVANGVTGLSVGGEVGVGGLKRGRVLAIVPVTEAGKLIRIDVDFELDSAITLYQNAEAVRVSPILGNTSWINIRSVGGPADLNGDGVLEPIAALAAGGTFSAVEAPGLLTNIVGSASAENIVTIIDRAKTFSTVLERVPKDYDEKVVPALDAASATIVQLRSDYDRWRVNIDATLTSAENAAKNLETGTQTANEVLADAKATLIESRPKIAATLDNLESASGGAKQAIDRINAETLPKVASMLGEGERAIGEFADMLDRVDGEIAQRMPEIRSFLNDLRVAAGQLKLATIEVRRSPWRLLYRPSTDVLAHEQLYEATRTFMMATSDLRSASDGLQELLKTRPDLLDGDPELKGRLQTSLIDAVGRYEEAQRRLYGVLTGEK